MLNANRFRKRPGALSRGTLLLGAALLLAAAAVAFVAIVRCQRAPASDLETMLQHIADPEREVEQAGSGSPTATRPESRATS